MHQNSLKSQEKAKGKTHQKCPRDTEKHQNRVKSSQNQSEKQKYAGIRGKSRQSATGNTSKIISKTRKIQQNRLKSKQNRASRRSRIIKSSVQISLSSHLSQSRSGKSSKSVAQEVSSGAYPGIITKSTQNHEKPYKTMEIKQNHGNPAKSSIRVLKIMKIHSKS